MAVSAASKAKAFFMDVAKPIIAGGILAIIWFFFSLRDRVSQLEVKVQVLEKAADKFDDRFTRLLERKVYGAGVVHGVLVAADKATLTLRTDEGPARTFKLTTQTKVRVHEKDATLADLLSANGRRVMVMPSEDDPDVAALVEIFGKRL